MRRGKFDITATIATTSTQGSDMSKLYSFSRIYYLTIAAVLFLAIGVLGTFWFVSEYKHHEKALELFQNDLIAERKTEVKALITDLVDNIEYQKDRVEANLKRDLSHDTAIAWNTANAIYQRYKDRLPEKEIKQLIITALMPMRFFNGRGYFWIHDTDYTLIAHPFRQGSIGNNDAELTDSQGQKIIRSFVQAATTNSDGGFVSYYWNKPGVDEKYHQEKGQKKIAHLRLFKPFNWAIGIGEYVVDSDEQLQQEVVKQIAAIRPDSRGYVFAHTRDGICLNHIDKTNIGKNRWELVTGDGMKVIQELDRVGRQSGGGFMQYIATIDPETGKPAKKISYVHAIKDWGWVVGGGVYLADIEKKMLASRQDLTDQLINKFTTTVLILLSVLAMAFLIGRKLFQRFLNELNLFAVDSREDNAINTLDLAQFKIKELHTIAHRTNVLLDENRLAQTKLNQAKRMESIGLMAGGVAHDLNNILAGIVGYPELLLRTLPADSQLRKSIEAIRDSGQRAAAVVTDLLTVARGAASIRETHEINSLIQEYLNSPEGLKLKSLYPDVTFSSSLTAVRSTVSCSPVHVKKCVMNLVTNAAEAVTGAGCVAIATENQVVDTVTSAHLDIPPGDYVVINVKDSGSGISSDDLMHIFEPFYSKKVLGRSGTGLGLSVVWNTMEDHAGKVFVDSSDQGTCFQLYFPTVQEEEGKPDTKTNEEDIAGNGEHLLVVDDEPHLRDIASQMLQSLGYKVDVASSGQEAVQLAQETTFDLIVLDMIMVPGISGRQTYKELLELNPSQRAIVASGYSETEDVKATIELGANGFIKKPYTMDSLGRAVKVSLNS